MADGANKSAFPNEGQPGMTKREYFSLKILQALIITMRVDQAYNQEALAKRALEQADAFLAELKK